MLYLEDLQPGMKRSFGRYEVTRDEVLDFARKYDPQPFHLSDEAAAQTHFKRLAASGWHTCSMTMAMFVAEMEAYPQASLGAAGIDELRWLKPVYPGDVLRCETEVIEVTPSRSRPEMGSVRSRMTTFN
ncbi:MAG: MaoC family dehydratase, partial [Hyphomicrobiales bacterium]